MWGWIKPVLEWLFKNKDRADFDAVSGQWRALTDTMNSRMNEAMKRLDEVEKNSDAKERELEAQYQNCIKEHQKTKEELLEFHSQVVVLNGRLDELERKKRKKGGSQQQPPLGPSQV